jgi:hypothetical protein
VLAGVGRLIKPAIVRVPAVRALEGEAVDPEFERPDPEVDALLLFE